MSCSEALLCVGSLLAAAAAPLATACGWLLSCPSSKAACGEGEMGRKKEAPPGSYCPWTSIWEACAWKIYTLHTLQPHATVSAESICCGDSGVLCFPVNKSWGTGDRCNANCLGSMLGQEVVSMQI